MGYNTKQLVEKALKDLPELRDDDRVLTLWIWAQQGLVLDKAQQDAFMQASSMDFIARRRRELMKKYPPSKAADERRHTHFNEELERYGKHWYSRKTA